MYCNKSFANTEKCVNIKRQYVLGTKVDSISFYSTS